LKGTLSARLIVWVGVPAVLLFAVVLAISAQRSFHQVLGQAKENTEETAFSHAARIETLLRQAQKIPEMMAVELESGRLDSEAKVEEYLHLIVQRNLGLIYGSCIAYKPHGFSPSRNGYAPYVYHAADGLKLEYLDDPSYDYFSWAWYREPRDAGRPLWSEPYFDEGGGKTWMITYSVPFRKDDLFLGIVTVDIALDRLFRQASNMSAKDSERLGESAYVMIVDRAERVLVAPWLDFSDASRKDRSAMAPFLREENPDLANLIRRPIDTCLPVWSKRDNAVMLAAFAPILQRDGGFDEVDAKPWEMLFIILSQRSEIIRPATNLLMWQIAIGLTGLAVLLGALIFVARSVSRPIRELSSAVKQIAAGNLELALQPNGSTEEVGRLTEAFNKMTRDLRMQMQELRYTTTVRERIEGELNAARNIQMSLLPKVFPAFPDRPEFDIHAVVRPAREVGGDFYDFFFIDQQRLCILISDVAGKGVPAALFMAVTKALIKATALSDSSLPKLMLAVNNELCEEADAGMFVTLLIVLLNTETGEIEYCNAGHLSPFLLESDGKVTPLEGGHSPALALAANLQFVTASHKLAPGDALFMCTDGVTEAVSKTRDFYTPRRLQIVLRDVYTLPVQRITRAVVQDVRAFSTDQEQADDISVLAVRWIGPVGSATDDLETVRGKEPHTTSLTPNLQPPNGR
jgi:sigma-B regulation protein RsbU (phosphoserine phosphatase)